MEDKNDAHSRTFAKNARTVQTGVAAYRTNIMKPTAATSDFNNQKAFPKMTGKKLTATEPKMITSKVAMTGKIGNRFSTNVTSLRTSTNSFAAKKKVAEQAFINAR